MRLNTYAEVIISSIYLLHRSVLDQSYRNDVSVVTSLPNLLFPLNRYQGYPIILGKLFHFAHLYRIYVILVKTSIRKSIATREKIFENNKSSTNECVELL